METKIKFPEFASIKDRNKWLIENKERLITAKKAEIKKADGVPFGVIADLDDAQVIEKGQAEDDDEKTEVRVKAIINTTNIMDSHNDVHFPGLWNKSLKENGLIMHVQEHKLEFDKIISDGPDLNAYAKTFNWRSLGFAFPGTTEALVFDSNVLKERNEFMFNQYRKGRVRNHSVGMQYVKIFLAVNDDEYGAEFEAWEKYIGQIVNAARAEEIGYFWGVKEARVIEGSAVPAGSNYATPTLEVKRLKPGQPTLNQDIISLRNELSEAEKVRKYFNSLKF